MTETPEEATKRLTALVEALKPSAVHLVTDFVVETVATVYRPWLWDGTFRATLLRFTGNVRYTPEQADEQVERKKTEARLLVRTILELATPILAADVWNETMTLAEDTAADHAWTSDAHDAIHALKNPYEKEA